MLPAGTVLARVPGFRTKLARGTMRVSRAGTARRGERAEPRGTVSALFVDVRYVNMGLSQPMTAIVRPTEKKRP
jgi:hypothetical protein